LAEIEARCDDAAGDVLGLGVRGALDRGGFLGCFGNCWLPIPLSKAASHISALARAVSMRYT
jgi:hypothetical protein